MIWYALTNESQVPNGYWKMVVLSHMMPNLKTWAYYKYIPVRPLRFAGQTLVTQSTFYGQRVFHFIAPSSCSDIPLHICKANSLQIFKGFLKTHLFDFFSSSLMFGVAHKGICIMRHINVSYFLLYCSSGMLTMQHFQCFIYIPRSEISSELLYSGLE